MYNYLTNLFCFFPICANILCTALYNKITEVRSPTFYYKNNTQDLNTVFYQPLLQNDYSETNETNETNEINETNETNETNEPNETNETNETNKINSIQLDISESSFYYSAEELNKQDINI